MKKENLTEPTPIFIIGAPRTGSTLLFQLLISKYTLAYLSNFSAFFSRFPVFALRVGLKLYKP